MSITKKKRKICFVITSVIHYGRNKILLEELKKHKDVELQIIVGASALLSEYGDVLSTMKKDGFKCSAKIIMTLAGGSPVAMAKTAGIGITEFATVFENLEPDIVIIRGDRYEMLAVALAASYLNIPIAHIEGGDLSGTIDESVRHAITKLSHIHFSTNDLSKDRIIRMGEQSDFVFNVGSPDIEFIARKKYKAHNKLVNYFGVGDSVNIDKPYLLVLNHPVTTEYGKNRKHTLELLNAIHELNIPTIWFWPNVDAGTDEVSKAIRVFRENNNSKHIRFIKYLPPEEFTGLLKKTLCVVGNSSSGIKECSYLGIPAVNIGSRQNGRMRGNNVIDVSKHRKNDIKKAIRQQLKVGKYKQDNLYYKKNTGKTIAGVLAKIDPVIQKKFHE
ncbi:MAG: UDP-N-acetylglucosamine 2-epimerase [Candidatus Pacebacteria bacterium]|jgi:UDP-hydrolysing UDP-N-acetyl-D-glucosamine 2-epimerase|nr:UDP-N-acetylglucosamine 2-epimerase [Candidatus Paceibacterota bacterium]MDP7466523.1 UDP-N-acetylglucosamine 2-epimerase [Candidatus Paceibacterota bacterium]